MSEIHNEIVVWLHQQQDWLQVVAKKIIYHGKVSDGDINELCALLKTQEGQRTDTNRDFSKFMDVNEHHGQLRIISIGEIEGIDNLAPRKPLLFGSNNLAVVYGSNGSGKSGYTRILNKACGKPNAVDLKSNVFAQPPAKQHCTINYSIDGDVHVKNWIANSEAIDVLKSIDIFDAYTGRLYLDNETNMTYVPETVAFFEEHGFSL